VLEEPVSRPEIELLVHHGAAAAETPVKFRGKLHSPRKKGGVDFFLIGADGKDCRLHGGDPGRKDKTVVVGVGHDDRSDKTGGNAPARGPCILEITVLVLELDVEGPGEILAEEMARSGLKGFSVAHHGFAGIGVVRPGEALSLGFLSFHHREGENVPHDPGVNAEHLQGLLHGLLPGAVGRVPFLPEEFRGPEEQPGTLFPSHDVRPLVDEDGKVSPGLYPFAVHVADDRLRRGADHQGLLEGLTACVGDHGALGSESFDVLRFLFKEGVRNEEGKIGVHMAGFFKSFIKMMLYGLPQGVSRRADDHAAPHRGIVCEFRSLDDVKIPLGVVVSSWCYVPCHLGSSCLCSVSFARLFGRRRKDYSSP